MTATQKPVRRAVEYYRRWDGETVALTYALKGWRHSVTRGEAEPERFEDIDQARRRWQELRLELQLRGFRKVQ